MDVKSKWEVERVLWDCGKTHDTSLLGLFFNLLYFILNKL